MKKIVLASNNKHKLKEFREIFKNYQILSLDDIGFDNEIEENGTSFLENALIKAETVSKYLQEKNISYDVIADDSGLCVKELNDEPGIYSARYSTSDAENRKKLLKNMEHLSDRSAYFVCFVVLYRPNGTYISANGKTYGTITKEERGSNDFGYDCIFLSNELDKTFGEATSEEKNNVSHRKKAIENLLKLYK